MRTMMAVAVMALAVAGCGEAPEEEAVDGTSTTEPAPAPEMRQADLVDGEGNPVGSVEYRSDGSDLTLMVQVSGLTEGTHAVHLHETGTCEGPGFQSAGGHWNPQGNQHGRDNPQGSHLGDLANMTVSADGTGRSDFIVEGVSLNSGQYMLEDADGTALLIHAGADDYQTDPSGDAGDRVACAVLGSGSGSAGTAGGANGGSAPNAMEATTGGNSMDAGAR